MRERTGRFLYSMQVENFSLKKKGKLQLYESIYAVINDFKRYGQKKVKEVKELKSR